MSIARAIVGRIAPAEIVLADSRAEGVHRSDSGVDLTAVCPNAASAVQADKVLHEKLAGRYDDPVVNVSTITQGEFLRLAPLAQSFAGQAARHGVTSDGESLGYQPDRQPAPGEIRDGTRLWVYLDREELEEVLYLAANPWVGESQRLPPMRSGHCGMPSRHSCTPATTRSGSAVTRLSCGGTFRESGP